MKNLPSVRKGRVEEVKNSLWNLKDGETIVIAEPCDCGSHIRHNNGGNYHGIITFTCDEGKLYIMEDSTCELSEPPEWEHIYMTKACDVIERCADWL